MTGGVGADFFVFNAGADVIEDYSVGVDELLLDGGLTLADISSAATGTWSGGGSGLILTFASGDTLMLDGISSFADLTRV